MDENTIIAIFASGEEELQDLDCAACESGDCETHIAAGGPGSGRHLEDGPLKGNEHRAKVILDGLRVHLWYDLSVQAHGAWPATKGMSTEEVYAGIRAHWDKLGKAKQDAMLDDKLNEMANSKGLSVAAKKILPKVRDDIKQHVSDRIHDDIESPDGEAKTRDFIRQTLTKHSISAEGTQGKWEIQDSYNFQGLPIEVENKKGSTRSGKEPSGKPWSQVMPFDYGYVKGTEGEDGDEVDVFIGPKKTAAFAYIVHQNKTEGKSSYDEDKVMLGFPSAEAAEKAYRSAYTNVDLFHSMTLLPMDEFKKKVFEGKGKIHAEASLYTSAMELQAANELDIQSKQFAKTLKLVLTAQRTDDVSQTFAADPTECDFCGTQLNGDDYLERKKKIACPLCADKMDRKAVTALLLSSNKAAIKAGGLGSGRHKISSTNAVLMKQHGYKFVLEDSDDKQYYKNGAHNVQIEKSGKWSHTHGYYRKMKTLGKGKSIASLSKHLSGDIKAGGPGSGRHKGFDEPMKPIKKPRLPSEDEIDQKEAKLEKRRQDEADKRAQLSKQGKSVRGKLVLSEKAQRAKVNTSLITKDHQDKAEGTEENVRKALGKNAKRFNQDSEPFDVVHTDEKGKKHGIEVKALLTQKNDKITQKGSAIARKTSYAKKNKIKGMHTVAVDFRSNPKNPDVYHKAGVGSFRLGTMTKVPGGFKGLKHFIK